MHRLLLSLFIASISCSAPTEDSKSRIDLKSELSAIHQLMDNWHQAAAIGDEQFFFEAMSEDAIYLGTDKSERWTKKEFEAWSMEYFERDTAWAFTPFNREVYFSKDGQTAWFEELLNTWMGTCRGAGVLTKKDSLWKLNHYNLSLVIDNNKIQQFIQINKE